MDEQLTPGMQQRVQVLQRYMRAMERGDVDTITTVLNEAEQDQALERMILEINEVYQYEDQALVQPADVALARQMLLNAVPAMSTVATEEMVAPSLLPSIALDRASEPAEIHPTTNHGAHKALP